MALRNITVDDRSSLITYTPASEWVMVHDTLDARGSHMLTNYITGEATITYTFLNMYYMSARWYYHVGAVIDVDGQVGIAAMRDYTTPPDPHTLKATMASSVVWSYKGDGMKERKITIKVPQGDDLTVPLTQLHSFEVDDAPATSNTSPLPSTSSTSTTPPSSSPSQPVVTNGSHGLSSPVKTMVISLSIVGTALLGLF
ncbi:hypothetical protein BJ165DRAFT_1528154 [Panaeolus papilionaceus]|nr:hypothetical protein BJ165DRAFT_1528154 [Panaeolus papilionaceus]